MQHERESLGRGQGLQHHHQGQPDRVGEKGFVLGVHPVRGADDRLGYVHTERFLPALSARTEDVQTDPCRHGGQPAAEVLDAGGRRSREAEPRLLDGVIRLADVTQHPVGQRSQARAVRLEPLHQPVWLIHGVTIPSPRVS